MKIKIARIITRMDLGGAQQAVLYLSKKLDHARFQQVVITGSGGLMLPELKHIESVRHYEIPELHRRISPWSIWSDLQAMAKIRNILQLEKPHLVHTHTPKAGILGRWAAWSARIPIILHTYHGFGFSESHGRLGREFYKWAERLTAKVTTQFVAVSDQNRIKGEKYRIFQRQACRLIRSGVDFTLFSSSARVKLQKKMELGLAPTDMIVGNVASFTPSKGLHFFLQAARKIKDQFPAVRFVIAGDGELRPQIEQMISQLRLEGSVQLLGWRSDIPELLNAFDIFLLTSLWEGLPRVLVEAALTGLPIVASNVDGVPEVTQEGRNGFLVAPGDTDAMAHRVMCLLRDHCLREQMGQNGRLIVEDFSLEKMLCEYGSLYFKLVGIPASA